MHNQNGLFIPANVPEKKRDAFIKNYNALTKNTNRLFLFSCDHKIEHLNNDCFGPEISPQALHPEHFFRIASQSNIGAMATHLGLIYRYGQQYPNVNYIAKLNGRTSLLAENQDPKSMLLWTIEDVIELKHNTQLMIPGVGITVYIGNEYESEHLSQAAQMISQAHREGLVTIVWMYARGNVVCDENNFNLIAGAAGIGLSLGADFVKIKPPASTSTLSSPQALKIACAAAGNTKVLCAGGEKQNAQEYITQLYEQIHLGDSAGTATGRNVFQRSLSEAITLNNAISAIVYDNVDLQTGLSLLQKDARSNL